MNQNLTYGDLDKALTRLQFESRKVDEKHLAYFNRKQDVLFTLPLAEQNTPVIPRHLSVARRMITEKGVATEEKWEAVIQDVIKETEAKNAKNGAALPELRELFASVPEDQLSLGKQVRQEEEVQRIGV